MSVYTAAADVLTPLVGKTVAQICLRSSAIKAGKSVEGLTTDDLDVLAEDIRVSMRPFASADLLEAAITQIRAQA